MSILTIFITLTSLAACFAVVQTNAPQVASITSQSNKVSNKKKPSPGNNYGFSEDAPEGVWSAQSDIDVYQSNDPNVPVVIAGANSYAGKGRWRKHVMLESVILKNRTSKAVRGVKFGWIILTERDRKAHKNREAAALQGFSQLFDVRLSAGRFTEVPVNIEIVKEAKSLLKTGTLSGTFFLRIRMSEVHFEDGSVWNENEHFAFWRKKLAHARTKLKELITFCSEKKNRVDVLVVNSVRRFSRDRYAHVTVRTLLCKRGITLRSATEPVDDSPAGKLVEGILSTIAQFENDEKAKRIWRPKAFRVGTRS